MKKRVLLLLIGMLIGGWIFSSIAFASALNVEFIPLKFFVNGEKVRTLPGQQAFVYNGRTYVPLRFVAESLGCSVDWDRVTSSVYMTITPDDIPAVPEPDEKIVCFTGVWKTELGSIYKLKQNGTSISGTFTHYVDKSKIDDKSKNTDKSSIEDESDNDEEPKYEFPLTGKVEDKTVELTWTYDNAEEYADVKDVPLEVAQKVVGISETVTLTLDQKNNILEGEYFQDYVEWDPKTNQVIAKSDGNSELANSKLPPLKLKLFFNNPI